MTAAAGLAALWIAAALAAMPLVIGLTKLASRRGGGGAEARRSLRLWSAATLALLAGAAGLQLENPGPGLLLAVLAGLLPLWVVLRHPRPSGGQSDTFAKAFTAARLVTLSGLALAMAAFAWSQLGAQQARIARLCEGQSAQLGGWNLALGEIGPLAGTGFTALQAEIAARRGDRAPLALAPQLRDYFDLAAQANAAPADTAIRARQWDGDLVVRFGGFDAAADCIALDAVWRPWLGAARLGCWLMALGAALLALLALGSLRWRMAARERLAMRREDRPLTAASQVSAAQRRAPPSWQLIAACLVLASGGYLLLDRLEVLSPAAAPVTPGFERGPALIAARQSLIEGPANLDQWIVIGDAMARRGRFGDAAEVLRGATASRPNEPQGWLALGDALYGHAGGQLTPAAELAYARADRAAARAGAPPLLVGTAMERSGRTELAARWWRRQLLRASTDAPWRATLEARLTAAQGAARRAEP